MSLATTTNIVSEETMILSDTDGLRLFVCNKRRADLKHSPGEKILLFVSGSTYPASTSFDLPLKGMSWMDQLAAQGYDTYLVDVRGYGRSDRLPEMDQPAEHNPPVVRTPVAVRDSALLWLTYRRAPVRRAST